MTFQPQLTQAKEMHENLKKRFKSLHISILCLHTLTQYNKNTLYRILIQTQEPRVSEYLMLNEAFGLIEKYRESTGSKLKLNIWNYDHFDFWVKRKSDVGGFPLNV